MRFVWALLAVAAIGAAGLGVACFLYAKDLPPLAGPQQIAAALERRVEAERLASAAAGGGAGDETKFEIVPLAQLPKGLVRGLLAFEGCPEYLDAPKEQGVARFSRVLGRVRSASGGEAGPGRCQLRFADLVAKAVGVASPMHAAIADHRILEALSTEQLLAYRLASTYYAPGVIGTRAASHRLFDLEPERLDLARSAELLLAENQFRKVAECSDPAQLKLLRDDVLSRLAAFGAVSEAEARAAQARPLGCARRR